MNTTFGESYLTRMKCLENVGLLCVDSVQGAGVWNMEQNDPDFFMQELNKQGLPYVVLEVESSGSARVVEDGK